MPGGRRCRELFHMTDIFPTFTGLAARTCIYAKSSIAAELEFEQVEAKTKRRILRHTAKMIRPRSTVWTNGMFLSKDHPQ